jgi:hypothetical protein
MAAIFAAAGRDLNAGDFISRGVEGIEQTCAKSIAWIKRLMETGKAGSGASETILRTLLSAHEPCI